MPAQNQSDFTTLGEWETARADMRIVCACGRTINLPAAKIIERFKSDGPISKALTRLRCGSCRRRGHATITHVPLLKL
jgi:hypothetical protein